LQLRCRPSPHPPLDQPRSAGAGRTHTRSRPLPRWRRTGRRAGEHPAAQPL